MPGPDENLTLVNPQNGNLAFKIFTFNDLSRFDHIQRNNYYSLIWIKEGRGTLKSDFNEYNWTANSLLAFAPYQPFMISAVEKANGLSINFHPDFFCIHKHHEAVGCNGVLFNNIYQSPVLKLDPDAIKKVEIQINQIKEEMINGELAQYELLLSHLKILLINVSRAKIAQEHGSGFLKDAKNTEPFVLQNLKKHIEEHFRTKHTTSEYADLLNITPKALTKATKKLYNKTTTDLISERIIIEAKRELYLTDKQVKLIANELGYKDEYYFSRFFKNYADVSPQMYRKTVGFNKAAS